MDVKEFSKIEVGTILERREMGKNNRYCVVGFDKETNVPLAVKATRVAYLDEWTVIK